MIKAIIFDFFDVFRTDTFKAWLVANEFSNEDEYFEASRRHDTGEITAEEFLQELGRMSGQHVTWETLDVASTIDDAVVELAGGLHKNYKTALLSNASSRLLRGILTENDLEWHFDEIIVSAEVGMAKPSREIFELALQRLKVKPDEAIFIDDNEGHVRAAESIGITGICFASAKQLEGALTQFGVISR